MVTKAKKIPPITSLGDLRRKAQTDPRYADLALAAASNLGGGGGTNVAEALRWLELNAMESQDLEGGGEDGVVAEINFCR